MSDQMVDLVKKEHKKARRFIKNLVSFPLDAIDEEDILQDIYSRLVSSSSITLPIEQLTYYFYKMIRNKIIDLFRSKRRRKKETISLDTTLSHEDGSLSLYDLLKDYRHQPDLVLDQKEFYQEIMDAVNSLSVEQREIVAYTEWEGKSFREISEATGVSINTLLSRKRYALGKLRERLNHLFESLESSIPRRNYVY